MKPAFSFFLIVIVLSVITHPVRANEDNGSFSYAFATLIVMSLPVPPEGSRLSANMLGQQYKLRTSRDYGLDKIGLIGAKVGAIYSDFETTVFGSDQTGKELLFSYWNYCYSGYLCFYGDEKVNHPKGIVTEITYKNLVYVSLIQRLEVRFYGIPDHDPENLPNSPLKGYGR